MSNKTQRVPMVKPEKVKLPPAAAGSDPVSGLLGEQPSKQRICGRCLQRPAHGLSDLCRECRRAKQYRGG